jgi:hypothetical protein
VAEAVPSTPPELINICNIRVDGSFYGADYGTIKAPPLEDISILAELTRHDGSSVRLKLSSDGNPGKTTVNIGDTLIGKVDISDGQDIIEHNTTTLQFGYVQQRNSNGTSFSSEVLTAACSLGSTINYSDFKPIDADKLACTVSVDKIPGALRAKLWKDLFVANQGNFKFRLYTTASDGRVSQGDQVEIYTTSASSPADHGHFKIALGGVGSDCASGGSLKLSDLH